MERVGLFLAGVATGWAVRTTVDSSRSLAVKVISGFYGAVDRASRAVGIEREHLEDLLAEARAQHEADRRTRAPANDQAPRGRPRRRAPHDRVGAPTAVPSRACGTALRIPVRRSLPTGASPTRP